MYMYIALLTVLFKTWISWVEVSSNRSECPLKKCNFCLLPLKATNDVCNFKYNCNWWCRLHYFLRMGKDIIKKFTSVSSLTIYISICKLFSILLYPSSGTDKAVLSIRFEVGGYLNKHLLENVCKTISLLSAH